MATLNPAHAFAPHADASAKPVTKAATPMPAMRCRRAVPADLDALAALLHRGFPERSVASWREGLRRLFAWTGARGLPGAGFVLDCGGTLGGVLLTIYGPDGRRCNLSSWYADEAYRRYASMLVNVAVKDKTVTFVNVSARRHTWPIIEAQGFRRYADGVMAALPLLTGGGTGDATVLRGPAPAGVAADPEILDLMREHAAMGCVALWCVVEGRARPFVFSRRKVKHLPVAQLVYCEEGTEWRRVGRALGRALAREGLFVLLIGADGPVPGLTGRYLPGRMPKFARGPLPQRGGDLAFTECAMFGT